MNDEIEKSLPLPNPTRKDQVLAHVKARAALDWFHRSKRELNEAIVAFNVSRRVAKKNLEGYRKTFRNAD